MTIASVVISPAADWPVARLIGEVDLTNVEQLTLTLRSAAPNHLLGLIVDLGGVTYLDSTGLRLLFRLNRELRDRQQQLRLVVPKTSLIWRVLRLGGVADVVAVFELVDDALESARAGAR